MVWVLCALVCREEVIAVGGARHLQHARKEAASQQVSHEQGHTSKVMSKVTSKITSKVTSKRMTRTRSGNGPMPVPDASKLQCKSQTPGAPCTTNISVLTCGAVSLKYLPGSNKSV